MGRYNPDPNDRLETVVKECRQALDHLRKAVDHTDGRDAFMLKLVATMRRVAGLVDEVVAQTDIAPPNAGRPGAEAEGASLRNRSA